jgi:hypothetical protein
MGNMNANGELLLTKCAEHNLTITNTYFPMNNKFKGTWRHPRSGHWHILDYIIVRREDLKYVTKAKARIDVDCWTDHRLVLANLDIKLKPKAFHREGVRKKRYQIENLHDPEVKHNLSALVREELSTMDRDMNANDTWVTIRNTINKACESTLGIAKGKRQEDWFNDSCDVIEPALKRKHDAFKRISSLSSTNDRANFEYGEAKTNLRREIRSAKNAWRKNKAEEIQKYADAHDQRNFYEAIKQIYGPKVKSTKPILDENGVLLRVESEIKERWKNHYSTVLNCSSDVDWEAIDLLPQYPINDGLDAPKSKDEVNTDIKQLRNN